MTRQQFVRGIAGILLAPFGAGAAVVLAFLVGLPFGFNWGTGPGTPVSDYLPAAIYISIVFGYPGVLLLGLPAALLLRWMRHESLAAYAVTGFILGLVFAELMFGQVSWTMSEIASELDSRPIGEPTAWPLLLTAALCGSGAAIVFWWIARRPLLLQPAPQAEAA